MKRALVVVTGLCLAGSAFAGFKVKLIKPKKPEQFQTRVIADSVTYAADLVIDDKEQRGYFYKEMSPAHVIAVRLAVFNKGGKELTLPLDRLQLIDPAGREVAILAPEAVAEALLKGLIVTAEVKDKGSVGVSPRLDPRLDPNDPRNDPSDPRYRRYPPVDPRTDPNDPNYDPTDPRNRNPNRTGPYIRSGVDIGTIPGVGGSGGDLSQYEKDLVVKDFADKAHSMEPVPASSSRDRFLYFTLPGKPATTKGFVLRLPQSKGMAQEVLLKF